MIALHDYILSSDCYKVRLLLSMLGLKHTPVKVNVFPGQEHRSPSFLGFNPFGDIPVLQDGDTTIRKPSAILFYLAKRYDATHQWMPDAVEEAAHVLEWLAYSEQELSAVGRMRMAAITARPSVAQDVRRAARALEILDDHLATVEQAGRQWIVGEQATIADIAIFPCAALAPDAEIQLNLYPAVWRWIQRIKALDGFIVMPGVLPNFAKAP